ncbi:MAG: hypothetical protein ACLPVY_22875 [Acidimicrobiia bacterium]
MTAASGLADALDRPVPPFGGFSPAILRLEVRRLLRNRRTMTFALVLPVILFWAFGLNPSFVHQRVGYGNESAFVMISMALYGAVFATRVAVRWSPSNASPDGAASCGSHRCRRLHTS